MVLRFHSLTTPEGIKGRFHAVTVQAHLRLPPSLMRRTGVTNALGLGLNRDSLLVLGNNYFRARLQAPQRIGKRQALRLFTVDDADLLDVARERFDVATQLVLVRVSGIGINRSDPRPHFVRFAEDTHWTPAREYLRAQGVLRAIADEEDQIGRIADVVLEMMPDAAGFRHA